MGGRGSGGSRNSGSTADYSMYSKWKNDAGYRNSEDLYNDGYRALNDYSLSALLKPENEIAQDFDPIKNLTKVFIWDNDFKRWNLAAEKRWK